MNLLASAPTWLAAILLLLVWLAAIEDGWRLRISNTLSGGIAIAAFVVIALDGPIIGLWQNLLLFAAVLAVGTFLFGRGLMGGGDIKLLAASALWFDLSYGWKMLVAVALAGGLLALAVMLLRFLPWPDSLRRRIALLRPGESIPYAIAIAAGVTAMAVWMRP